MKKIKLLKALGCIALIATPIISMPIVLTAGCSSNSDPLDPKESIAISNVDSQYTAKVDGPNLDIEPICTVVTANENKTIDWSSSPEMSEFFINVNTGEIKFMPKKEGVFVVTIRAALRYQSTLFTTFDITFNVGKPDLKQINITGINSSYNTTTTGAPIVIRAKADVLPVGAQNAVYWTITPENNGIKIDRMNGVMTIDPQTLGAGVFNIAVNAQSLVDLLIDGTFNTTITITKTIAVSSIEELVLMQDGAELPPSEYRFVTSYTTKLVANDTTLPDIVFNDISVGFKINGNSEEVVPYSAIANLITFEVITDSCSGLSTDSPMIFNDGTFSITNEHWMKLYQESSSIIIYSNATGVSTDPGYFRFAGFFKLAWGVNSDNLTTSAIELVVTEI